VRGRKRLFFPLPPGGRKVIIDYVMGRTVYVSAVLAGVLLPAGRWAAGQEDQPARPARDAAAQAEDQPAKQAEPPHRLTLAEVAEMRRERLSQAKIVEKAAEQGAGFEVTAAVRFQLRRMGFDADQIEALQAAYTAKAEKSVPLVPGQGLRTTDAQRDKILEQITEITKASGAAVAPVAARHVTLWASQDDQRVYLPDIQKLEKLLESKCKEPIRSGLDKRSAHVILIKHRYEYEKWILAMFDVLGDPFAQDNPGSTVGLKAAMLKWPGYCPPNFSVFCMEGQTVDRLHRFVATGMGYMYFTQLVESQRHAPLATGFANGLEAALAGTPSVMLFSNSYQNENRNLGADGRAWIHLVQHRIATKEISPPAELLRMDTTNMLLPHYAEAWSLVGLLARQPAKFAELVLALRAEKDALKTVERVYGWNEKELVQRWHAHVLEQR
jgi:hypothetical protein